MVLVAAALSWPQSTVGQSPPSAATSAAKPAPASCDEFLPPRQQVGEKLVGPHECLIAADDIVFNIKGKPFRRLELRISGTVAGFALRRQRRRKPGQRRIFTARTHRLVHQARRARSRQSGAVILKLGRRAAATALPVRTGETVRTLSRRHLALQFSQAVPATRWRRMET
jgi:hypothetical protein